MDTQETLLAYAKEIGLHDPNGLTLEKLIESHRNMREYVRALVNERNAQWAATIEHANKMAEANPTCISYEKLRNMTVSELVALLAD